MTISRQEVDQMAQFMRALNGEAGIAPSHESASTATTTRPMTTLSDKEHATQDMKMILERFHAAADNAVDKVHLEAKHDRVLREALLTESTASGSRMGDWEIQMREEGKRKFYDVVQTDGVVCIASDLLLYEAAYGLVRILNNGGRVNSHEVINLLRSERDYASALNDAVLYKHYLVKNPKDRRAAVFEAKYSAAKQRAIVARDAISILAERR